MTNLIVCATDFSPEANSALAWAAAVARRVGGNVDLVHVEALDSKDIGAMGRLREEAHAVAHDVDVSVRPKLLRGEADQEILRHAREGGASMIVLGSHGGGGLKRWALGSVAERTLRSAECPVVVVPRAPDDHDWFAAKKESPGAPRVVVGLGSGPDRELVQFVASLRGRTPCDVTFLQLYWPLEEYARLGLHGRRDFVGPDADVVKDLEPGLRSKIGDLSGAGAIDVDIRPAWGDPAANLLVAVEEHDAELIVVGAGHAHGLTRFMTGSIAERLARQSRYIPVACVPADNVAAQAPATTPTPNLRTVLAVTDLSVAGNAAIPHAYSLLRGNGGVVELCHVFEHALASPPYAYDLPNEGLTDLQRARLLRELRALVPPDADSFKISTHVSIVDGGKAAEAIVQAAERLKVDVISMASHGRSGLSATILGSVAQDVVHRAHKPVLIVRGR